MKTGTPPRVDGRSLDYSKMEVQQGDAIMEGFSFMDTRLFVIALPLLVAASWALYNIGRLAIQQIQRLSRLCRECEIK
jgi:hypothetical protein